MNQPGAVAVRNEGFSLIEVLVALIVLSVGLLGVARMQSLAMSSTTTASKRGLAAIEAASLAALMHENRGYWTTGDPSNATITITGSVFTYANGAAALSAAAAGIPGCLATVCLPPALAAYDLRLWAIGPTGVSGLLALIPNATTTIKCGNVSPVSCDITISWLESSVSLNASQLAAETASQTAMAADPNTAAGFERPTYTLFVQP